MMKLSTRSRKNREVIARANRSTRKHKPLLGTPLAPYVRRMALRFFALSLAVALGACSDKDTETPAPASPPAPAPALTAVKAEIQAAESTNGAQLEAAQSLLQQLSEEKAQAVGEKLTDAMARIDRAGVAQHKEVQALEQAAREIEAQKAELAEEESEAASITDNPEEAPPSLTTPHSTLADVPALARALRLSSPILLPKLADTLALPYAQILKRDAETMLIVTIANRGLRIVQIKTTGADQNPSQTVTQIPLNLEPDSLEPTNLRKVRLTAQHGLDVLLLNHTNLELIRLDAAFAVKSRSVYRNFNYDAKLGFTAVFPSADSVVWTSEGFLLKAGPKLGRATFCHLPYRGHFGVAVDHAVQIYETEKRGEFLAIGYSDLNLLPVAERALRITFAAPPTRENPCGIRTLAETQHPFGIAGSINQNLGNYFYAHGPQRLGLSANAIQRPSAEAKDGYSAKLYANAFVAAGHVAGISALRDETQIDILGSDLKPQASYKHASKISDAGALNAHSTDLLVVDSQGTLTLVDVTSVLTGAANAARETRRLSDAPFPIRLLDVRLGEKSDIVPFVIGHDYGDRNFDQIGFIRVAPAK